MSTYTVAVRTLCAFTAREGDLDQGLGFGPSAQEGIEGHQWIASRRGEHYESEITLSADHGALHVRGRADGYDPRLGRLEEVKTFRGDLDRLPAQRRALHWAQARVYGAMLCQARGLESLRVALVYFDIDRQRETVIEQTHSAAELQSHLDRHCALFLAWAEQELAHRQARDAAMAALTFPHPQFRQGQRPLAEAVFRAAKSGRCLSVQAPTGIGKTVGTLFPLLKAMPGQQLDKIFYLTAKTPGRQLALHALGQLLPALDKPEPPLPPGTPRVLELTAREKACENPGAACRGDECPLAQGFYDRLPAARLQAVHRVRLDKTTLRGVALAHQVCPYYLAQELIPWSDVVVGDYNHYFDSSAVLRALAVEEDWRTALLVDEAHNLLDRARGMFSAELHGASLRSVRRATPRLKRSWDRIARAWQGWLKTRDATLAYQASDDLPDSLVEALRLSAADIADHLVHHPEALEGEVQQFFFDMLHVVRLADQFGPHSIVDLHQDLQAPTRDRMARCMLCIRNVVPAPFLRPSLALAHTATLFSATFGPPEFYADMLGLPDDRAHIDVESPFDAQQLEVHVARHISTRYNRRSASIAPMVALMARQYTQRPGNYLAFFSSFDYLDQVATAFATAWPDIPTWQQSRRMDESAREQFLARFEAGGQGIAFAVLGGAFAEGIDLPGNRLIGAFVATLGLPQINPVNEQFRERLESLFGRGYDYTYLYPGLQKVVQAAGRVIRTTQDEGSIHLIDDRYARPDVQALLPVWWDVPGRHTATSS
ncbi:Rad3-related DNA helicase [Comamonas sp. BIGb0124]|uniref:ATP-dependent DNA helicase n=1 Tax=Comamonas sp. BIGb0124 TaxID=2485130 RepID=UPI000F49F2F0|nr:ATP-dependent DNA helicase [Comamonas sp. BIGb0124]ROR26557.1 Rad3-related DNA helicase [Comamonas sp. BIGb0124]